MLYDMSCIVYQFVSKGVMTPSIPSAEVAMKLALIGLFVILIMRIVEFALRSTNVHVYIHYAGTLPDHFIGERVIVDYLLYKLNQCHLYKYVAHTHYTTVRFRGLHHYPSIDTLTFISFLSRAMTLRVFWTLSAGELEL